jgi:ATP-dependent 26S proteasome regulatory subunit
MSSPSIDPVAREILIALVSHIKRKAQRLLEGDDAGPAPPSIEPITEKIVPLIEGYEPPLNLLERSFQLTPLEYASVLCLLAAEVEPFFRTLIRAQQREGGKPWLELGTIADVLELDAQVLPDLFEAFLPTGKLRTSGLALADEGSDTGEVPMIHLRVKATRRLLRFALGNNDLPDGISLLAQPRHVLEQSLLSAGERDELLSRIRFAILRGDPLLIDLHGPDGIGKKYLAEGLAAELGRPILYVDVRTWDRRNLYGHIADAVREATIANALPYFDRWSCLIEDDLAPPPPPVDMDEGQPTPSSTRPLPPLFGLFLDRFRGVLFLGSRERHQLLDRGPTPVTRVAFKFPGPTQRGNLWKSSVEAAGARMADGIDPDEIGRKFALDPARIVAATRAAVELATRRHPGRAVVIDRAEIIEASRHQLQHELASLAVRVTKAHKWEDLVIPTDVYHSLNELLAYMRHAGEVYEKQGFGARHSVSPGLSALFAGPPGTGKTMCASIVARELDMELFRVDLSRITSKWIGETEKNLAKVFDEAQRSHAVILFDEADSMFAKRTEVKSSIDRYANLEVSFLLQRMEQFSGVTILTTNFEDTIDPAFKRRITFKMRFEKPDGEARASLWAKMFPAQARLGDDIDFKEIGNRFELSGGSIRNAVIRSAFLAVEEGTPIHQRHILTAAAREAREMGALVNEARPAPPEGEEASPAAGPAGEPPDDEPPPDKRPPESTGRRARVVPITHPRR